MTSALHSTQTKLFPAVDTCTVYEQPLNERMRNFLRLEALFGAIADSLEGDAAWAAKHAIVAMIDISDQLARIDIKGELIKEIERHASTLNSLRDNPRVNQATLERTVARLEPILATLKSNACQPGLRLRQSELITQVRQRLAIPGGTCSFDLPALHYWLHRTREQRGRQLLEWMHDLRIVEDAVQIVLQLVRDSAIPHRITAEGGFFQKQLDQNSQCQLVRIVVADADEVYPEISGGKHRFAVRFIRCGEGPARPQPVQEPVHFELQCCAL